MLAVDLRDPVRRKPGLRRDPLARAAGYRLIQQPFHPREGTLRSCAAVRDIVRYRSITSARSCEENAADSGTGAPSSFEIERYQFMGCPRTTEASPPSIQHAHGGCEAFARRHRHLERESPSQSANGPSVISVPCSSSPARSTRPVTRHRLISPTGRSSTSVRILPGQAYKGILPPVARRCESKILPQLDEFLRRLERPFCSDRLSKARSQAVIASSFRRLHCEARDQRRDRRLRIANVSPPIPRTSNGPGYYRMRPAIACCPCPEDDRLRHGASEGTINITTITFRR